MTQSEAGTTLLAEGLRTLGVEVLFTVPGSQNVPALDALRREGLSLVTATSELTAAFMANGYARVRRTPAVLLTIPGPGFAFALPGIAEARLDSVPLVWIALAPTSAGDGRRTLQSIPQRQMAAPLVKAVVEAGEAGEIPAALGRAVRLAGQGEPGPVLLHLSQEARSGSEFRSSGNLFPAEEVGSTGHEAVLRAPEPGADLLERALTSLEAAQRPLLLVGQGGLDAPEAVRRLAERLRAPVITTTSARGVLPEGHPLVVPADRPGESPDFVNELVEEADLVLVLGCGLSHNGSHGFRLRLPGEKLVRVDSSAEAFRGPYRGRLELHCDVRSFLQRALARAPGADGGEASAPGRTAWTDAELERWRQRAGAAKGGGGGEPRIPGPGDGTPASLIRALRAALPDDGLVVTDSGRHQMLVRRYLEVRRPGGLVAPSDFQSMGFGIPAALGAKVAAPDREVVAVVGDGGFHMTMGELLVAARDGLAVRIVVFRDDELALIADHQRRDHGSATGTALRNPDIGAVARALGVRSLKIKGTKHAEGTFREMCAAGGPVVVEVPLRRSLGSRTEQARALARETVRDALGPDAVARIRKALNRGQADG